MALPELNRCLKLEAPLRVADGQGGYTQGWETLGTIWAEIAPRTGRSVSGLEVSLSRMSYRITVRAAPQGAPSRPKPGQRLLDGARVFDIQAVTESRAGVKYLDCFAEEELAQ
ncbi:head-tail adaptor protein [Maribius pontilimi]|uniref:Head-tail adaptor protein n=1 Tax=Palleronia pontilimi TaxID=1964209 RepID=A0A934M8Y7_9RHOB|nr:head-tail adaptor protein [Palleronia pontilimi]MBJ3761927.1 head-tail adaptor protein [Palleronia pontilimi]